MKPTKLVSKKHPIKHIHDSDEQGIPWPSSQITLDKCVDIGQVRSEILLLNKINKGLHGNTELDGLYPKLLDGGWVRQPAETGQVLDTTRRMLFMINEEQQKRTPYCAHLRYTMAPIGKPLESTLSASELIIALYDIMRCHRAIYNDCSILHRDISDNNILVVRIGDSVHGLLIDFDCAVDTSVRSRFGRPEQTGTVPFMSIGNLDNSDVPRTMLDDWESLLYLVCWYGTFGIDVDCTDEKCRHHINKWRVRNEAELARQKRADLNTISGFEDNIASDFGKHDLKLGDGNILKKLAIHLHYYMFFNPRFGTAFNCPYHGARLTRSAICMDSIFEDEEEEYADLDASTVPIPENTDKTSGNTNPFAMRAEKERIIAQVLLKVLGRHAALARKKLQADK